MSPHSLITILLLTISITINTSHGLNILDKLARIKDSLLGTQRQISFSSKKYNFLNEKKIENTIKNNQDE